MPAELNCPIHGPYKASLGSCPECSGKGRTRPGEPNPLREDDLETDVGQRNSNRARYDDGDEATVIPPGRKRSWEDDDDDEKTKVVRGKGSIIDETEIMDKAKECEAILWVKEGDRRGKIYRLKEETEIGRENCEIELDDVKVSKRHAKIVLRDEQYIIADMLSKNGTSINGEKIAAETALKENDLIKIGETVFVLKVLQ